MARRRKSARRSFSPFEWRRICSASMPPALVLPPRRPLPDTDEADERRLLPMPRSLPASLPLSSASFCSMRAKRSRADGGRRGCSSPVPEVPPAVLLLLLPAADDPAARRRRDAPLDAECDDVAPLELLEVDIFNALLPPPPVLMELIEWRCIF